MNTTGPLANGLYPINRRVRRPFIIADDDAAPASSATGGGGNAESPAPAETSKPESDAGVTREKARDNATEN